MAIGALYEVDVMTALGIGESGVHSFHVQAAIGEARVTIGAGGASLLPMFLMTGETTQAFVDTDGCAVVTGRHLRRGKRRVTLVAEGLPGVGTCLDGAFGVAHAGQRQ